MLHRSRSTASRNSSYIEFPSAFRTHWNKIEHRLFSQISINWRGRPLTSHEVVV
ncbi:ISAzo13-like element transposase-related protein, partial [Streptomyces mirabilis]|uniref:ISAzo13-like element transposase-related protein n=2 Tax=Streptomyces TaxID=1883 RepID=UPI003697DC2B